ncbi:bifunctional (p)ppGpp synthetase/guanosine-3',5'-bis(diphosphate) 3'-pyrophosphohydrolase, partial [Candidatus Peregrinibacteria bacterium]|nr:bifunctional (p)ppGpp synthetase/guanosine-3',5'-bis(diphosphate) 3'-pyrophosphohydrolase [Candidatus Peregrinibacteria bacterium]
MSRLFDQFVGELQKREMCISIERLAHVSKFFEKHDFFNEEKTLKESIEVVKILLDVQCDEEMLLSALLYRFLEKEEGYASKLREVFGESVYQIIEGLGKMRKIESLAQAKEVVILRKMLLAMSEDPRVIFIKLAERLAFARQIELLPQEEREGYLQEVLSIYVPIATRLGAYYFKEHLEEESFRVLFPQDYKDISKRLKRYSKKQEVVLQLAKKQIKALLSEVGLPCYDIEYRVKRKYSIWEKMKKNQEEDIENIYDIFAIRIITNTVENCYEILGLVHKEWTPIQSRMKDYIAVPKANNYQSIHTTLLGLGTSKKNYKPVEIQIRTQEMHEEAERGFAAHWSYKEGKSAMNRQWIESLEHLAEDVSESEEALFENAHDDY